MTDGPPSTGQCRNDSECPADQFCDPITMACAPGCSRDEACAGDTPHCNPMTHTCVPCVVDMHCPAGQVCRGNRCVMGCAAGQACPGGLMCCADACVDTQSNSANCGGCGTNCTVANAEANCTMGRCGVGRCSGGFGDCDNMPANGCETDLRTAVTNCGRCGNPCPVPPNAMATCTMGMCGLQCLPNFADCNMNPADGCETDLRASATNCGRCGMVCTSPNGNAACVGGACTVAMCSPGFGDCDNMPANGCETNLNTTVGSCGMCNRACPMPANGVAGCVGGMCTGTCNPGFADCNRNLVDGCEVNTRTDAMNCGSCGRGCNLANAVSDCADGSCRLVRCNPGFADCDGNPLNGCEVNLQTSLTHCGRCGNVCPVPAGGGPTCIAGVCGVGNCIRPLADCNMNPGDGCEVNTDIDALNCGSCNSRCVAAQNSSPLCRGAQCLIGPCNPGFGNCDGIDPNGCETNIQNDARNCGACGRVCGPFANAVAGCGMSNCNIVSCNAGFANCDNVVATGCEVNIGNDASNCGGCGVACPAGQTCNGGACGCPAGTTLCNGACVNTQNNAANCGMCNRACAAAQTCVAGNCQCAAGQTLCGAACVDIQTSAGNCGACGRACAADQACVMGACIGTGVLRFTATWSRAGDVDLHVVPPCGTEIYYVTRSACGGSLDRDDTSGTGPENVFWMAGAAVGQYHVCAFPYSITGPTTVTINVVRGAITVATYMRTFLASSGNGVCSPASPAFLGTYTY